MKTFYSHLDYPGRGTVSHLFSYYYKLKEVDEPNDADIIIWNGGEDIGTTIYHEQPVYRGIPFQRSPRDIDEIALFDEYKNNPSKFLLGICRGAQLLNCLNGGSLYQDVDGHQQSHEMLDLNSGEVINVTSTHHQQMIPAEGGAALLGVSSCSTYKDREYGIQHFSTTKDLKHGLDAEIVWYPASRSLCIQGHPEYVPNSRFAKYTLDLINQLHKESVSFAA